VRGLLSPLVKLLVFLVVTLTATYVLAQTISNADYGRATTYRADFTDVTGLQDGDDVRIAGVRVGSITQIKIVDHDTAEISFTVQSSRAVPKSAIATLKFRNLLGERYLDISLGPGSPNDVLPSHGLIPHIADGVQQTFNAVDLTTLFGGFQPLFQSIDPGEINDLSANIIEVLQGESGSVDELFANVADITNTLANKDQVIGDLIDNLNSVLTTVAQHDNELSSLISELQQFVSGLASDRTQIGNSISGINSLTSATAGLLTNIRAPLATDVKDLNSLATNLNASGPLLATTIQNFPTKLGELTRTASYGSWFNFYACELGGTLTLPGNVDVTLPLTTSPATPRCQ
jgi:phospholipid/cholesterol/gamma-HCH transport system substrate-binding protein